MSLAVAGGVPSYSDSPSGTRTFIPEIWSGKLIEKFYDATVLAAISNTDYEGEIKKFGDKVKIRTTPTATVRDYTRGSAITYEKPDGTVIELEINKGKYYAAEVDDVSAKQQDVKALDTWATDASEQMKIAIDTDVLGAVYSQADAANKGAAAGRISQNINLGATGAAVQLTKTSILDFLVDVGTVMDEQNIPESGRFILLPAWAVGLIKKSDLREASISGDSVSILRNGRVGMVDRFTIYMSNLLPSVTDGADTCWHCIAGHPKALTFASQMTEMETLRSQDYFADLMRGLQVYGYKVVLAKALCDLYVKR